VTPRSYGVTLRRSPPLRLDRHAGAPTTAWRTWALEQERPLAVDLFCGAGGLSHGLEAEGFVVALSVDSDPWALETHRHNFPGAALQLDLSEPSRVDDLIALLDGLPIELVAGGPPCQPFSRAARSKIRSLVDEGSRDAVDGRRDLWQVFVQVVEAVRPRAVLMENVPDMALGDDSATVRHIVDRLERAGYDTDLALVEARLLGIPQHRERMILVGLRDAGTFEWPAERARVTVRDAIGDLPALGVSSGALELPYGAPDTAFQHEARGGATPADVIHDHVTRQVRDDDREAFELMADGVRYPELPERLRRYRSDIFDDKYNRLEWDELSRSITAHIAKDGYWYIHPGEHRTLTVREAARLQTFPDRFRFAGTRSHAFHQIGNAVPPQLARTIAAQLIEALNRPHVDSATRSARRRDLRRRMLTWAGSALPASCEPGIPWAALVVATMGRARLNADTVLLTLPTPASVTPGRVRSLAQQVPPGDRAADALARLAAAAPAARAGDWDSAAAAAGLGPAGLCWLDHVGLQVDGVIASTATLRVAARLDGTTVDRRRSLSDGKVALALLVGTGPDVPRVNAALAHLGATVCGPQPDCSSCPVAPACESASALAGGVR